MMDAVVYLVTSPRSTGFYIGSTTNFGNRISAHMSELRNGCHANSNLQNMFNLTGGVEFTVLNEGSREDMYLEEQRWLDDNDPDMLNISANVKGGDSFRRHPDQERFRLNKSIAVTGDKNPMYGRTHTDAAKDKISRANKGNQYSLGRTHTEENKKLFSDLAKLRTGEKNSFFGKSHSIEYKQAASERMRGCKPSNSNQIEIDGVLYLSQADAAKALGVAQGTITHRLGSKNSKYKNYRVVQQG